MSDLTVSETAKRLGITAQRTRTLLTRGDITGHQLANGLWFVDSRSLARYQLIRPGRGRRLSSPAAWGLLWELSGLPQSWPSPSTAARVRSRIRTATAQEIATAVAARTRAHRFTAANASRAQAGLIATGRAAASVLGTELIDDSRHVSGYVRRGPVGAYAAANFMVADVSGDDILYANTLPAVYEGDVMPAAVVAADLATSTDTRERRAGLSALERMRQAWLDAH